jgi:lysophospholipase L1-like esterase
VLDPSCTPTTTALISFQLAGAIRGGNHPPLIACAPTAITLGSTGVKVGDVFVLDAGEQAKLAATITAYNNYIASQASTNGWAYYDPNATLTTLKASGCIVSLINLASATQPFGPCISLDGVHPAAPAHKAVANDLIKTINAAYKTSIPSIS